MKCLICCQLKPSKAFIPRNLSEACDHPPNICMRCFCEGCTNSSKPEVYTCSWPGCGKHVDKDKDGGLVQEIREVLDMLFPTMTDVASEVSSSNTSNSLTISLIDGTAYEVDLTDIVTLPQLALKLKEMITGNSDKLVFLHNDKGVSLYEDRRERTLEEEGITSRSDVRLLLRDGHISEYVREVVFTVEAIYSPNLYERVMKKTPDALDVQCYACYEKKVQKAENIDINYCKKEIENEGRKCKTIYRLFVCNTSHEILRFFFTIHSKSGSKINKFEDVVLSVTSYHNVESTPGQPEKTVGEEIENNLLTPARKQARALVICALTREPKGGWELFSLGEKVGSTETKSANFPELLQKKVEDMNGQSSRYLKNRSTETNVKDPEQCLLQ